MQSKYNENLKEQQLLVLDYQNIQDNQYLEQITQIYRIRIQQILEQIKEYSNIISRNKQQHQTVTSKMKQQKQQHKTKNIQLSDQIEKAKNKFESQIKQLTQEHQKNLKNIQQKTHDYICDQQQRIKGLLGNLDSYRDRQIEELSYLNQIQQKTKALIDNQYTHHDNMNVQQSLQKQQTATVINKNLEIIQDLKKNANKYAQKVVYEQKQLNQQKNYRLKHRLIVLQQQLNKLRTQRNQLVGHKKQNKINISINQDQLEQYKAVGSLQKSKIKMYQDKIDYTKKNITNQLGKLQNKIKQKKGKCDSEAKGLKMKLYTLEKQKQQLRNNLEKYKMLGETILLQREEVQEFFVLAIQQCKKQMLQVGPMQENNEKQYGEKVDIDELSAKDKHRILTNLYTKLALGPK